MREFDLDDEIRVRFYKDLIIGWKVISEPDETADKKSGVVETTDWFMRPIVIGDSKGYEMQEYESREILSKGVKVWVIPEHRMVYSIRLHFERKIDGKFIDSHENVFIFVEGVDDETDCVLYILNHFGHENGKIIHTL